jgi:hypothetical protein
MAGMEMTSAKTVLAAKTRVAVDLVWLVAHHDFN